MNRFENLKYFIGVVDNGGISAAADQLGVAKSAVSRRLKELETHLRVELFHRTTRRMNLTDTGRSFYDRAVRILDDLHEAELSASQEHQTLRGSLKVALPSSFGLMHMTPAINEFLALHPDIEFDLDFNDRQVDLIEEGFDLAIRIADLPDSSLIARRLASIGHVVCASPAYLQEHGTPQHPKELAEHRCLTYNLLKHPDQWAFRQGSSAPMKVKINSHIQASTGHFLRDAAANGHGITYLPTFIAYKQIEEGSLLTVLNDYERITLNAYAVYPPTRHLSQRVRSFVDFLAERFQGTPYWEQCLVR